MTISMYSKATRSARTTLGINDSIVQYGSGGRGDNNHTENDLTPGMTYRRRR